MGDYLPLEFDMLLFISTIDNITVSPYTDWQADRNIYCVVLCSSGMRIKLFSVLITINYCTVMSSVSCHQLINVLTPRLSPRRDCHTTQRKVSTSRRAIIAIVVDICVSSTANIVLKIMENSIRYTTIELMQLIRNSLLLVFCESRHTLEYYSRYSFEV